MMIRHNSNEINRKYIILLGAFFPRDHPEGFRMVLGLSGIVFDSFFTKCIKDI